MILLDDELEVIKDGLNQINTDEIYDDNEDQLRIHFTLEKIVNEIERRKEIASLDFEDDCLSCKL